MAEQIGEFKVTTSNGSKRNNQRSSLRVYRGAEVVLVMHRDPMGSILTKVRRWPDSEERAEFIEKAQKGGLSEEEVKLILTTQGTKTTREGFPVERRQGV